MFSTLPHISESSSPYTNTFVTVQSTPIPIGITVTIIIIIIIIASFYICLTGGFSLKCERQQVFSGLQDSSNYFWGCHRGRNG